MIRIKEAIGIIRRNSFRQQKRIEVPILESIDYVLAEDIVSDINVPNFPRAAMDGFAVNTNDFEDFQDQIALDIEDYIPAGKKDLKKYKVNHCARIMTGAPIPEGYNSVVKQEMVQYNDKRAIFYQRPHPGKHIVSIGEDIKYGEKLIPKYSLIKPAHIGIMASIGRDSVKVVQPIKISYISTGSEITEPGKPLEDGKVYNNSIYNMAALSKKYNMDIQSMDSCKDDMDELKNIFLKRSKKADIVITTGGVSVGDMDLIPEVVHELGGQMIIDSIAMKPGTPVKVSIINDTLFIHCSGNPFASYINFNLLFWPFAHIYYGSNFFGFVKKNRILKDDACISSSLDRLHRGTMDEKNVYLMKNNYSSSISNLSNCNCIVFQPANRDLIPENTVEVFYIKDEY